MANGAKTEAPSKSFKMMLMPSVHHLTPTIVSSRMECQTISRLYILSSVQPSKFLGLLRRPPSCCLICK